jgi:hypothetical protein
LRTEFDDCSRLAPVTAAGLPTSSLRAEIAHVWWGAKTRCFGLDVLADDRPDDRGGESLAQPALRIRVLAGPLLLDWEAVRIQVVGDQVRAEAPHVRRVGFQPLGDLL